MIRSIPRVLVSMLTLVGCPKADPCGELVRDRATESCVCPDGFTPRPELGICEGPDGDVIRYDAGPISDAGLDAPDRPDTGLDSGIDSCVERTFYRDADEDGFGDPASAESACVAPDGFVENSTDCDDACEACFPGGTEVCDERDNDCDGAEDEGVLSTFYRDMDGDTFGDPTMARQACAAPAGHVANDDDCNDGCAACRPGGTEVCEGSLDENCSMGVDEGCGCTNGAVRACPGGSDVGACVAGSQTCAGGMWGPCLGAVGPAAETCDAIDNDCDAIPDNGTAAASCGAVSRATGVSCSAGSCFVSSCVAGYRDCDGMFGNGCEAQLGTVAACLSCGDVCGWDCEATGCNDATAVGAGDDHTCVVRSGDLVCWGQGTSGQLGGGTSTSSASPRSIAVVATSMDGGDAHTCVVRTGGGVSCWGDNNYGQVGTGSSPPLTYNTPQNVVGLTGVAAQVAAGNDNTCVRMGNGGVWCWGYNVNGELGIGSSGPSSSSPRLVSSLPPASDVSVGQGTVCVALADRTARCWGSNGSGKLGNGSFAASSSSPVVVTGLSDVQKVSVGGGFVCALRMGGSVSCWGANGAGQLGNGTTSGSRTPVAVSTLTDAVAVSAGEAHACAVRASGSVVCWGAGAEGNLGNGGTSNSSTPVPVMGIRNAVDVAAGRRHTCALLDDGGLRCWGLNADGQLGDDTAMTRPTPVIPTPP